jgi:NADPH:quinone reductase-like Zn-dependent oxidoreductase
VQADLDFTAEGLSWVFNAHVVAFGGLLLLGGRLSDLFGARRISSTGWAVLAVGSLVAGLAPSGPVEILGSPTDGTHAELVMVPAENVVPKPERLSWAQAAALPMAGVTAWRALVSRGGLVSGETVIVGAASSGVGTCAIQIAKELGARVVAVTSANRADALRSLGADAVVLRTESGLSAALAQVAGNADLALDPTGALWQPFADALRPGGRLVAVGKMAADQAAIRVQSVYWKQLDIRGSSMGSPRDFDALMRHVATSAWSPVIDSAFPLERINDAYSRLDSPDRVGKVIIAMPGA